MGSNLPTPAALAGHPELQEAARQYLASPAINPATPSGGPSASGEFHLKVPVADVSELGKTAITVVNGNLQVIKQRKLKQAEWLDFHMALVKRLAAFERGEPASIDTLAFATITTAATLTLYITWVFNMVENHTWEVMRVFDEHIRDQMNQLQSGSYELTHILTTFLTRLAASDTLAKKMAKGKEGTGQENLCNAFQTQAGCPRSSANCRYVHKCKTCGSSAHGKSGHTAS